MRDNNFQMEIKMYFYFYWNDTRITKMTNLNETSWQPVKASLARSKFYVPELYIYLIAEFKTLQAFDIPMDFFYLKNNRMK